MKNTEHLQPESSSIQELEIAAERYQRLADELRTRACLGDNKSLDPEIDHVQALANEAMRHLVQANGGRGFIITTDPPELKPDTFSFDHLAGTLMPGGIGSHPNYRTFLRGKAPNKNLRR